MRTLGHVVSTGKRVMRCVARAMSSTPSLDLSDASCEQHGHETFAHAQSYRAACVGAGRRFFVASFANAGFFAFTWLLTA